MLRTKTVNE